MAQEWVERVPGIDSNGCPTERLQVDGQSLVIHYGDIPDYDVTTVHGIPVTTPLRTVIDVAPDLDLGELDEIVRDCLGRGLFTVAEAMTRIAQPDMRSRPGALLLRTLLEGD